MPTIFHRVVKELDAGGRYYRQVLEEERFQPLSKFRLLAFPQNERQARRRELVARENLSQYPNFDEQSCLLTNIYYRDGRTMAHILIIPRPTPDVLPDYHREPRDEETYIVRAWDSAVPEVTRTILLLSSEEFVVPSALRIASRRLKTSITNVELDIRSVSKEEFYKTLETLDDQGERLPYHLQRLIRDANVQVLAEKRNFPARTTRESLAI